MVRVIKVFAWGIGSLAALFIILIILINIPSIQTFITGKISNSLSKKIGTEISVGRVKIAFPKTVLINEIFVTGQQSDTLLYVEEIRINVDLLKIIRQEINVNNLRIAGLVSHIRRDGVENKFNFQFILDAFTPTDTIPSPGNEERAPWLINVRKIELENIYAGYYDEVVGINATLNLGQLLLLVKTLDLTTMDFEAQKLDLLNTVGFVEMWDVQKPLDKETVSDESKPDSLPIVGLELLNLENVHLRYVNKDEQQDFSAAVGNLTFTSKSVDLNRQELDLGELILQNSSFEAQLASTPENENAVSIDHPVQSSIFPDWMITMDKIEIEQVDLKYDDVSAPKVSAGLDYGHLSVEGLMLKTGNLRVSPEGLQADIQTISFKEQSGLDLHQLTAQIELSNQIAELNNFEIETSKSNISGDIRLGFASFKDLQNEIGKTAISLLLNKLSVNTEDVFLFAPDLAADSLLGKFQNQTITVAAKVEGKVNNLKIESLDFRGLKSTQLRANGRITGLPDVSNLGFNLTIESLVTKPADLFLFIDTAVFTGITLPESLKIKGAAIGKMNDFDAEVYVNTDFGKVSAGAFYQKINKTARDTFNVTFEINDFKAGLLLADTTFGILNLSGSVAGTGAASDSIAAVAGLAILKAGFNNYIYQNINTNARANGKMLWLDMQSEDPNLLFDLNLEADMTSEMQTYSAQINLDTLNLSALNFVNGKNIISTTILARANYASMENFDAAISATSTKLVAEKMVLPLNLLEIEAMVFNDSIRAALKSDIVDASLTGNFKIDELQGVIGAAMKQYFGITDSVGVSPETNIAFSIDTHFPESLKNQIGETFNLSDIKNMNGSYTGKNNELSVEMRLDNLVYGSIIMDTLTMEVNGKNDSLAFSLELRKISYDSLSLQNFIIHESVSKGKILSEIKILDSQGNPRYLFLNDIKVSDSATEISFVRDGLILDGQTWSVEEDNYLRIQPGGIESHQFFFTNQDKSVVFISEDRQQKFEFNAFSLENLLNIVDFAGFDEPVKGKLGGEITFGESDGQYLYDIDLAIDSLFLLNQLAGNYAIKAKADSTNLELDLQLKNLKNELSLTGNILNWNKTPEPDLELLIGFTDLYLMEAYTMGAASDMSGKVTGEISITGTILKPVIAGVIGFEEAVATINSLNFQTRLRNEKLTFDKRGLHFDQFVIEDDQQQKLSINGSLLTENYNDFVFDLQIASDNFKPISSSATDNKTFYGNLFITTDLKLQGTPESPIVDANVKLNKGTNLTYVMEGSELKLVTPEGIVEFVDHSLQSDSTVIATTGDYITDSIISRISGIDLTANLQIDPDATFTVIIDPRSGDYLTISGSAVLSIAADRSGNQTITGIYEVRSGVYQLSFYGLVKKSFTFQQGSNISWSGKPMDASLNITAGYEVTTNSVALVANESSSMTESEQNMYKQRLPYSVLLNINGFIAQPEISFNITLPDKYMVNYPQVASKLSQLNTPEMESERNKQVFALLVTGSFIADNPFASTGSSTANIATTAARNSVNGILADQMNKISSKYVKNVDLNFGLNSYEDYSGSSSEVRTELEVQVSKKLMNDRLTVEAQGSFDVEGSNNNTNQSSQEMWGEFAVTYSIDPEGKYKLRVYRENAYDIFDGEVAYSGIAFIFEREFQSILKKGKKQNDSIQNIAAPTIEGIKSEPQNK
ncbi:MAG: translocation/assembly module TamB [Bacteroidales bacterium]|nr:translocation/assembly module TamB [Bacteroidales bacterium]